MPHGRRGGCKKQRREARRQDAQKRLAAVAKKLADKRRAERIAAMHTDPAWVIP